MSMNNISFCIEKYENQAWDPVLQIRAECVIENNVPAFSINTYVVCTEKNLLIVETVL